jgi:hypothetical protein
VVEDDVEEDLEAGTVESLHEIAELVERPAAVVRRELRAKVPGRATPDVRDAVYPATWSSYTIVSSRARAGGRSPSQSYAVGLTTSARRELATLSSGRHAAARLHCDVITRRA